MRYVLDTNIVSELARPNPDSHCLAWLASHAEDCCLTTITLAEIRYGIERLRAGKRKQALARQYGFLTEDFAEWILDFDEGAAHEFGRYVAEYEAARGLEAVKAADVRDLQIGAIARHLGLTVATRNIPDFPLVLTVNPFQPIW